MYPKSNKAVIGDCEASHFDGLGVNVEITMTHGNMWLCAACLTKENEATARSKAAIQVVEDARKKDSQVELKQDLFNAGTVSFIELSAAIEANAEIAPDKKNDAIMAEVANRIEKLTAAIFAEEASLVAKKNERHALLVNAQRIAASLHESEKAKYPQFDINYKPQVKTSSKPKLVKTRKPFDKAALYDAAKKYGVPAPQVQAIIVAQNKSAEDAAKHLATIMGLL
jgi:hypothetical protein